MILEPSWGIAGKGTITDCMMPSSSPKSFEKDPRKSKHPTYIVTESHVHCQYSFIVKSQKVYLLKRFFSHLRTHSKESTTHEPWASWKSSIRIASTMDSSATCQLLQFNNAATRADFTKVGGACGELPLIPLGQSFPNYSLL